VNSVWNSHRCASAHGPIFPDAAFQKALEHSDIAAEIAGYSTLLATRCPSTHLRGADRLHAFLVRHCLDSTDDPVPALGDDSSRRTSLRSSCEESIEVTLGFSIYGVLFEIFLGGLVGRPS
jgi:hypothetical protein